MWPSEGIEEVKKCPWCGSMRRALMYSELSDIIFKTAPGIWDLWRCAECSSGYIDPRPTLSSIHIAYKGYYTHGRNGTWREKLNLNQWIRLSLINGYRNKAFGAKFRPSISAGYFLTKLRSETVKIVHDDLRYIPPIGNSGKPRILDIGCGNGGYLDVVSQGGWYAFGCDPDPSAAQAAHDAKIEVRTGGSQTWADQKGSFDIITISHVIEHLHDPLAELERIYLLLKPGGFLYIDLPNVNSFGHSFWGRYSFGLDIPRHLNLPTKKVLLESLEKKGFVNAQNLCRPNMWKKLSVYSARLELGRDYRDSSCDKKLRLPEHRLARNNCFNPDNAEFLTVTCRKPIE